jgi:hypothetical protein
MNAPWNPTIRPLRGLVIPAGRTFLEFHAHLDDPRAR